MCFILILECPYNNNYFAIQSQVIVLIRKTYQQQIIVSRKFCAFAPPQKKLFIFVNAVQRGAAHID